MTADNRWAVYKTKTKNTDSPKPTTKPSTIGKAGREGLGAGQGRGKRRQRQFKAIVGFWPGGVKGNRK